MQHSHKQQSQQSQLGFAKRYGNEPTVTEQVTLTSCTNVLSVFIKASRFTVPWVR